MNKPKPTEWQPFEGTYETKLVTQIPLSNPYSYGNNKYSVKYRMSDDPSGEEYNYLINSIEHLLEIKAWFQQGKLKLNTRCIVQVLRNKLDRKKRNLWRDAITEYDAKEALKHGIR